MNIDLSKYLKNKDIKITNDDIDLTKLESDLKKGYVSESDLKDKYISKSDYDKLNGDYDGLKNKFTTLETNYNSTIKTLDDTNDKLKITSLEKSMIGAGFKEEHFKEVSTLRNSLYADEKDDGVAIKGIAEKYKATYFPGDNASTPNVPNEAGIGGANGSANSVKGEEIKVTRSTRLSDMITKK